MNQENHPTKYIKTPPIWKIIIKTCITLFVIYCFLAFTAFTIHFFAESSFEATDEAQTIRYCDTYFYEKDYLSLYSELYMKALYDEKYDMYWEAANGYMDYSQYIQYQNAVKKGIKDSEIYLEKYKQKVLENERDCKFEQNKKQLEEYVKLIN